MLLSENKISFFKRNKNVYFIDQGKDNSDDSERANMWNALVIIIPKVEGYLVRSREKYTTLKSDFSIQGKLLQCSDLHLYSAVSHSLMVHWCCGALKTFFFFNAWQWNRLEKQSQLELHRMKQGKTFGPLVSVWICPWPGHEENIYMSLSFFFSGFSGHIFPV